MWDVAGQVYLEPKLYCYHKDQPGSYGETIAQSIGDTVYHYPGEWHCYEICIINNTVGVADGIARMWIDGVLKAEKTDFEWRTIEGLHINEVNFDAYAGSDGGCLPPQDQKCYDDALVAGTAYIGPIYPLTKNGSIGI